MITITLPCTQREQIEQLVHTIKITHIDTQQVEKEALVYQEIQHLAGGDYHCDVYSAPQSTKNRWTVNYIRHCLSDYELALYDLDAIDGDKNRNYAYFKELLLHRIMEIYPQYTDECNSQIQHEREKYSSKTKKTKGDLTMKNDCLSMAIPVVAPEHKVMLTIEETCGVFGIGEHTIRKLVQSRPDAEYLFRVGTKTLIKRVLFENYIVQETELHY